MDLRDDILRYHEQLCLLDSFAWVRCHYKTSLANDWVINIPHGVFVAARVDFDFDVERVELQVMDWDLWLLLAVIGHWTQNQQTYIMILLSPVLDVA